MVAHMIEVSVGHHPQGDVHTIQVSGHALFAPKGEDIVCAAVSAVVIGTINAIDQLLRVEPNVIMDEQTGTINCDVTHLRSHKQYEHVQLLLAGMLVSLQAIEMEYGDYLTIKEV